MKPIIASNLQFWMYDLGNNQLITTGIIPGDISDTKNVVYVETPIAGLNYAPTIYGNSGNRKISFTLQLIRRNIGTGNIMLVKQFEALRNQVTGLSMANAATRFVPPKVLYHWGANAIPLVYFVTKCDFVHKAGWTNVAGVPQNSEVSIELTMDESDKVNRAEEIFRNIAIRIPAMVEELETRLTRKGRTV